MSKHKTDKRLLDPEKKPYRVPTESEEWARYGCHDNEEWHGHLNKLMWDGDMPKLR